MLESVLRAYGLDVKAVQVEQFGTGLINNTWKIKSGDNEFILQRINQDVFKQPDNIAHNLKVIGNHFKQYHPAYYFVGPIATKHGKAMVVNKEGQFRMFSFVPGSHAKNVVKTVKQAYEAAVQFGRFAKLLVGVDVSQIKITLPNFHNLSYRYQQFLECLQKGNAKRLAEVKNLIDKVVEHVGTVEQCEQIKGNPSFKIRVMHHDTKISNVLFDANDKSICVIDFDTVMPGYFFSDVGDMMRTYLSAASEEERDFSKIVIRDEFYWAIVDGYKSEMGNELTETESKHFFYAAKFMVYMQAMRFLTDYINDDVYYGSKYESHNFVRATNQLTLLQRLLEKEALLSCGLATPIPNQ